ncbi:MAG: tryptophan synthase subunit alpha [Clostridiales Family XIII bacterium]|jgi:tryptophan synthase alpha chain|nr:tryptophan synthase subunit alpha [Clostridiales Family XIII bacterium]
MSRISQAFEGKKAFIAFLTGGDPDIETSEKLIRTIAEEGADIIEIGIPFSDPLAEGPVIEDADERALASGCTVDLLFEMVGRLREDIDIPLLFMTYYNPVFKYGAAKFAKNCAICGIDGLIVPDLPFEESAELLLPLHENGLELVSMITPTSGERAVRIAKEAEGFIYCVSSLGVTGVRANLSDEIGGVIEQVKTVTDVPCAIGFGISTPEQAAKMAAISDGIIIGSAIVRIVAEHGRGSVEPVREYVRAIRQGV